MMEHFVFQRHSFLAIAIHITYTQPPLESLDTEYKLPVYMSVRDWKGGFTRAEVKDSKNFKKYMV